MSMKTYSVEENVMLSNLLIWTLSVLGLLQVPPGDVLLRNASLDEQVASTSAATAQGTEDHCGRLAAKSLLGGSNVASDLVYELGLVKVVAAAVGEGANAWKLLAGVGELPGQGLDAESGTSESCMISEGADSAAVLINKLVRSAGCSGPRREKDMEKGGYSQTQDRRERNRHEGNG